MYAKSGPNQLGILWLAQGIWLGHTTLRGGMIDLEGDNGKGQVENASH